MLEDAFHPRGEITVGWVMSAISMALITVTTTVGNVVVLRAVKRAQRAPAHYPLASLAAADLLVGVSVMPLSVARDLFVFHLPWSVCAFWSTMDVLCCTASILSICALGWERWCGITDPLNSTRRMRWAKVSAALIWPASTIIALPTVFIPSQKHDISGPIKVCTINTNVSYVFTSITFSFYIPAGIMVFFYASIIRSLASPLPIRADRGRTPRNAAQMMNGASNKISLKFSTPSPKESVKILKPPTKPKLYTTPNGNHLGLPAENADSVPSPLKESGSYGGIIPRHRRATRTIVKLMSLFLICWTPFFVMLPVDSLCECVNNVTFTWCTWLGFANSALNPLVYAFASPSVRRALRNSLNRSRSAYVTGIPLSSCVRKP